MKVEMVVDTFISADKGTLIEVNEKEGMRLLSLGFAKAYAEKVEKAEKPKKKKSED